MSEDIQTVAFRGATGHYALERPTFIAATIRVIPVGAQSNESRMFACGGDRRAEETEDQQKRRLVRELFAGLEAESLRAQGLIDG